MSHRMTSLAMKAKGLKPGPKIVLYWLADHHNGKTGLCCPSIETLADEAEMDRTTVMRHLKALEASGLISRTPRFRSDGARTSDSFTLHLDAKSQNATTPSRKMQPTPVAKCDTNLGSVTLEDNTHPNGCGADAPDVGFWNFSSKILQRSGIGDREARSLLGKWTKAKGREEVGQVVADAAKTADPVAYASRALDGKTQQDELEAFRKSREGLSYAW